VGRPELARSRVLDLLGFEAQLVSATFATAMFSLPHNVKGYSDPIGA
jgi:hypothetical protein